MNQVDNLKGMVDAFSEYARAPSLRLQPVDLNALVSEVAELYRINDQQIDVTLDLEELPMIYLDSGRIRQLVVNLLKNAFEALESDTEYRRVSLCTKYLHTNEDSPEVCLSVSDSGSGIPADILPSLFEPYVSGKQAGSGLGLSIVKKIVEEHSARVIAQNNEQYGATISIYFPVEAGVELKKGQSLEVKHVT